MGLTRIPRTIPEFNNYVVNTDRYLQSNKTLKVGVRLGLTLINVSDWNEKAIKWKELYKLYKDPLKSGPAAKKNIADFIRTFKTFANPIIRRIVANENKTIEDALVFNFVFARKKPSIQLVPIKEQCYAVAERLGGGKFKFKCRTLKKAKKCKIAKGATCLEYAYEIGDNDHIAIDADNCETKRMNSKSIFIFSAGTLNSGKYLYIYFRWINHKHPHLNGPWSRMQKLLIV